MWCSGCLIGGCTYIQKRPLGGRGRSEEVPAESGDRVERRSVSREGARDRKTRGGSESGSWPCSAEATGASVSPILAGTSLSTVRAAAACTACWNTHVPLQCAPICSMCVVYILSYWVSSCCTLCSMSPSVPLYAASASLYVLLQCSLWVPLVLMPSCCSMCIFRPVRTLLQNAAYTVCGI